MESMNAQDVPGKGNLIPAFEPESVDQGWENSLHIMGLQEMVTTVHDCPTQAHTDAPLTGVSEWHASDFLSKDFHRLIEEIRTDMEHSVNERHALKQKKKAARKNADRPEYAIDVPEWRKQFRRLVAEGRSDLNIGYWRVSTAKQKEKEGPDTQIKDILGYSFATINRGVDLWCCDVDSGKEESREGLDFVLECIATGKVDRVVVQRMDRFARNNYLAECIHREAKSRRVTLCSATEHFPEGPLGVAFRQLVQVMAQYEAALIVARLAGGKRVKKEREGTWGGGEVPYGYWSVGDGRLSICEPEARIVRLIFVLYELRYNQSAIAEALNKWGIATRHGGRLGWRQGQIRRFLCNEAKYRAEAPFSETVKNPKAIAHPPILPTRPIGQRTYLFGTVKTRLRAAIPEDLALGSFDVYLPAVSHHKLTADQAVTIKTMFSLRDSGLSIASVRDELNRLGLKSLLGKSWKWTNVQAYLSRRSMYEPAIRAAGVTSADVERRLSPGDVEAAGVERIFELRKHGLSFPQIRDRLIREGLKTATGSDWSISSIHRVVSGKKRASLVP